jgi:hypothetical protein
MSKKNNILITFLTKIEVYYGFYLHKMLYFHQEFGFMFCSTLEYLREPSMSWLYFLLQLYSFDSSIILCVGQAGHATENSIPKNGVLGEFQRAVIFL